MPLRVPAGQRSGCRR